MTAVHEPELGLFTVQRVLVDAIAGGGPDFAAVRARLVHLADQHDALARSGSASWDVGELGGRLCRDLVEVVDRLERGELRRAARRFAAVLRARTGIVGVSPDWRRVVPA